MSRQRKPTSVKELFYSFERHGARAAKSVLQSAKAVRQVHIEAYRMAQDYVGLERADLEELIEMIRGKHGNVPDPLDRWLDEWFGPLKGVIEDDHMALIKAVREGMTVNKYLTERAGGFLYKKKQTEIKERALERAAEPTEPSPDLSPAEQIDYLRAQLESVRAQVKDEQQRRRIAERRVAELTREMKRILTRIVKAA